MNSTPDGPAPSSPDEPTGGAPAGDAPAGADAPGAPQEPVVPPEPWAPPAQDHPLTPGHSPVGHPVYPAAGAGYPPFDPATGAGYPPPPRGLSFGAKVGLGVAIGVVAHVLGIVALFVILGRSDGPGGLFVALSPLIVVAIAAIAMMFFPKTRPWATGILIIVASMWLVVLGPCIVLLAGLGGF